MAYRIRAETLTFTCSFAGGVMKYVNYVTTEPDATNSLVNDCTVGCTAFGGYRFTVQFGNTMTGPVITLLLYHPGSGGPVVSHSYPLPNVEHYTDGTRPDVWRLDVSGTWTLQIDAYLMFDLGSPTFAPGVPPFPAFGGVRSADPPKAANASLYYIPKPGGTVSMSLTTSGGSVSYSETLGTGTGSGDLTMTVQESVYNRGVTWVVHYDLAPMTSGRSQIYPGEAQSLAVTANCNGAPLTAPGYSFAHGGGTVNGALTASIIEATADAETHTAIISVTGQPQRSYALHVALAALNQPYPVTVGLAVDEDALHLGVAHDVGGGSFSLSKVQHQYAVGVATADGTTDPSPPAVNEFAPVRCWLRPGTTGDTPTHGDTTSLTALGEDPTDWRVMQRGFRWNAMGVTQAASVSVDSAPSASHWTAGAHTTLSEGLTITVDSAESGMSGGPGSVSSPLSATASSTLKGSLFNGVSFVGYRYLRLALTADADNQPVRVVLGSKQWDAKASLSGTAAYVDIDLCNPTNGTVSTDATDTTWPYNAPTGITLVDGPLWGVSNVASLSLQNLAPGHVYTLASVSLVRKDHSLLTLLPSRPGWVQKYPDTHAGEVTTTTNCRRFIQGDTDGRQSLEIEDVDWIHTDDGMGVTTDSYNDVSIANLIAGTLQMGSPMPSCGWTATDSLPNPHTTLTGGTPPSLRDDYLNSDLPAVYLMGGGMLFGTNGSVSYGMDIDASGAASLTGQLLFDELTSWPPCGDVFGLGDTAHPPTDGTIFLGAGKILRGNSWGLVLDKTGPKSEVLVRLTKTGSMPAEDDGSAQSDSIGEYRQVVSGAATGGIGTGLAFGKGLVSYDTIAQFGSTSKITRAQLARRRMRACFAVMAAIGKGCLEIDSPRGYLQCTVDPRIQALHLSDYTQVFASDAYHVDAWKCLRYEVRRFTLSALGETANPSDATKTTFSLFTSQDCGLTLTPVSTMIANSALLEKDSEAGMQFFFYENDDPGHADAHTVYLITTTDGWQTYSSPVTCQLWDGSALNDLKAILLDSSQDGRAGAKMTLLCQQGTDTVLLESLNKGVHWTLKQTF